MDISIPYYEDLSRISNSNIGWFLQKGPAYLHKMLTDPPPEEKNPVLERGTMIHEYLLQPEEFQKDYVVWDKSRPNSAQQEKFCQALASSLEIEPNRAILSAYKEAYSTAGKSEDKMLSEGLKIASTLKDYIDFLKENDGRIMITPSEYRMLEKIKHNIQSHKLAANIIWPRGISGRYTLDCPITTIMYDNFIGDPTEVTFHEFHINWEWDTPWKDFQNWNENEYGEKHVDDSERFSVKCKSLLDSLTLDFKNKIITIMDLKTTAKLWHFEDSIEMYDYLRQLSYYMWAVIWYMRNELNIDIKGWTFKFYIIAIDTTGSNEIRVFKFEQWQMIQPSAKIFMAMKDIAWHQKNNKWEHSREYYEGDGSESLNL
jgi:hypothetical protein